MDFYDLVGPGFKPDGDLAARLGYKSVFTAGNELLVIDAGKESGGHLPYVANGNNQGRLAYHAKNGAQGVMPDGFAADASLIETMRDGECIMVIAISQITQAGAESRPKMLYMAAKLFSACRKAGINVAFVSMARSRAYLESYIQMIELAKLIGADEQYARYSISRVNGTLGGMHD